MLEKVHSAGRHCYWRGEGEFFKPALSLDSVSEILKHVLPLQGDHELMGKINSFSGLLAAHCHAGTAKHFITLTCWFSKDVEGSECFFQLVITNSQLFVSVCF